MTKIAFLGLGAMGARMAARLRDAGHELTLWNRTPGGADRLVAAGAALAPTPRAAAEGAEAVFSMVREDAASAEVWLDPETGALAGLGPEAIGLECSTISIPHARALGAAFDAAERRLLEAPVAGSRPQAEAGALIFLLGGDADDAARARPWLEPMAGAVHHAGGRGAGAAIKLAVNAMLGTQVALVAELLGLLARSGVALEQAMAVLGAVPVCSPAAKLAGEAMAAKRFAPAFPIPLMSKDFNLLAASASEAGARTPVAAAVGAAFAEAAEAGLGANNVTEIVLSRL